MKSHSKNKMTQIQETETQQESKKMESSGDKVLTSEEILSNASSDDWKDGKTASVYCGLDIMFPARNERKFDIVGDEHQKTKIITSKTNIFDSHCHFDDIFKRIWNIDRINFYNPTSPQMKALLDRFKVDGPLGILMELNSCAHHQFEGCVNVIYDPMSFEQKDWEWIVNREPGVWLALGCHPNKAHLFDEPAHFYLTKAMEHPRVVALGKYILVHRYVSV